MKVEKLCVVPLEFNIVRSWWLSGKESVSAGAAGDLGLLPGWEDPWRKGEQCNNLSILAWKSHG